MSKRDFKKYIFDAEYRTIALTGLSGIFLLLRWLGWLKGVLPFDAAWGSILISGIPIIRAAVIGLIKEFDIKAGILVSIALVAAMAIGEYFAAGEVAFIMMIGEILEGRTVGKAREGIKKLIGLTPQVARIRTDSGERKAGVESVKVGDILLVKPGEAIPVDGVIISGKTTINQAIMTGESIPVDKSVGDEVFVGTLNQLGAIEVEATKVGEDTSLSKLIRLVKEAEEKKAPVVRIEDQMATIIVPLALALSLVTYLFTGDITRAVTILVVFCPCALVLATPTAIMAGIGNAVRRGILIKSGEAMEKAGKIDTVAFDKTGTITSGKPEVVDIVSLDEKYREEDVLRIAAVAEKFSEHPLGKAIYKKAQERSLSVNDPDEFDIRLGQGIIARTAFKKILVGNLKLLEEHKVFVAEDDMELVRGYESQGKTVMLVVEEDRIAGFITVADQVKKRAVETVNSIKKMRIRDILLLTGDNKNTAIFIGRMAGMDGKLIHAEQIPEGKVKIIEKYRDKKRKVCMVGDGINDAPALATAYVGVAMGALGTDVAVETADIALMSDDIGKIPELIGLSRKVLRTVKVNIAAAMVINFGAILLAAMGIINPVVGALVHNAGSVLVVMNSATLIKAKGLIDM